MYRVEFPHDSISVDVDGFKNKTKQYLLERIEGEVIIRQRCYRDGRWDVTIQTPYYPSRPYYSRRYKLMWTDCYIRERLNDIIEDYDRWINSHE